MITTNRSIQHFSQAAGTGTVNFVRFPSSVYLSVPAGASATIDFDGQAAAAGVVPMALAPGFYRFDISVGSMIIVATGGTVTGVGYGS